MSKKLIAYSGKKFTIEWHFDKHDKSQARDYYQDLDQVGRDKVLHLFRLMGDMGMIHNIEKFRNEGDQIYAFKPGSDRFLSFFVKGSKIIITNAFAKKTDKLPLKEKSRALNCMFDYCERVKGGIYYDQEKK